MPDSPAPEPLSAPSTPSRPGPPPRRRRPLTYEGALLVIAYGVCASLFVLAHGGQEPFDDAFFFKRVAINALHHGTLAWNVDEGPTYGNTSLLFQWLAVPVAALSDDYYCQATRFISLISLWGAFFVLFRMTRRLDRGLAALLLWTSPIALYPLLSGMETTFALLLICVSLWLTLSPSARRLPRGLAPIAALAVYLARPDALLLVVVPLLQSRFAIGEACVEREMNPGVGGERERQQGAQVPTRMPMQRRLPLLEVAIVALGLLGIFGTCQWLLGTPLPLPFYAKQAAFSPYDTHFIALSRQSGLLRFAVFALFAGPMFVLALGKRDPVNIGLLSAVVLHSAYHLLFTIDVMGMRGRFYLPALPLLVIAAARAMPSLRLRSIVPWTAALGFALMFGVLGFGEALPRQGDEHIAEALCLTVVPAFAIAIGLAGRPAALPWLQGLLLLASAVACVPRLLTEPVAFYSDTAFLDRHTARHTIHRGLDTLRACFGERIHAYHSEIGVIGLRLQQGKVTDLAGLQSPRWLFREPGSFNRLCEQDHPQAIFLPHKVYQGLNREIAASRCLRQHYTRVVAQSSSPLHVHNGLLERYLRCAALRRDRWVR